MVEGEVGKKDWFLERKFNFMERGWYVKGIVIERRLYFEKVVLVGRVEVVGVFGSWMVYSWCWEVYS